MKCLNGIVKAQLIFHEIVKRFSIYHVEENGDRCFSKFRFRNERHLQEVAHHVRHEGNLVVAQVEPHLTNLQTHFFAHVFVLENKTD